MSVMAALDHLPEFKQRKVFDLVDAIEAFVAAKVEYERNPGHEWRSTTDLDRARDELQTKLAELVR